MLFFTHLRFFFNKESNSLFIKIMPTKISVSKLE